jgi:hypothetical protein
MAKVGAVNALRVRLEELRARMMGLRGQIPLARLVRPGEARAALREIKALAMGCEVLVAELVRVADQIVGEDKVR